MTYYEILEKIRLIENKRNEVDENGEFLYTDNDIESELKKIESTKENKILAYQHIIMQKKSNIEICKEQKTSIDRTIKNEEKEIIRLNDNLGLLLDGEKLQTNIGSFYYGKESLYIENESKFKKDNPEYVEEKQSISKTINKEKVREDIEKVKGARLRKGVIFRGKKER